MFVNKILGVFRWAWPFFVSALFPLGCVGCGADDFVICQTCLNKIQIEDSAVAKEGNLDGLIVAAKDYSQIDKYIWQLKYNYVTLLAEPLSQLMIGRLRTAAIGENDFVVTPVPLHARRQRERGFNQAQLLANEVSRHFDWPKINALKRGRYTRPQVSLGRAERLKNVKDSFVADERLADQVKGRAIILVDDVYTTGATMAECADILRLNGAKEIYGLVLAKG